MVRLFHSTPDLSFSPDPPLPPTHRYPYLLPTATPTSFPPLPLPPTQPYLLLPTYSYLPPTPTTYLPTPPTLLPIHTPTTYLPLFTYPHLPFHPYLLPTHLPFPPTYPYPAHQLFAILSHTSHYLYLSLPQPSLTICFSTVCTCTFDH